MNIAKFALAGGMVALLPAGFVMAEATAASGPNQPTSAEQIAFEYDNYLYFAQEDEPGEPAGDAPPALIEAPIQEPGQPPSDAPPAKVPAQEEAAPLAEDYGCSVVSDCGGGSCCASSCCGIVYGGWLDQGFTANFDDPDNRSNFPVGYNDRSNDYQFNQLWVYAEKPVCTYGGGWDVGGRVDFVYGTDARFVTALGLDDDWDGPGQTHSALPQLYAEVAKNNLSIKLGHFWSTFGYEHAAAPENFFYSHSVAFVFTQPRTFTGALATYRLKPGLSIDAGLHRGWNKWEDDNDQIGFIGGVTWRSCDRRTWARFVVSSSTEEYDTFVEQIPVDLDFDLDSSVDVFELILAHRINCCLLYVIESTNTRITTEEDDGTSVDDNRYGITQYLIYDINGCLSTGLRFEWFAADVDIDAPIQIAGPTQVNGYALTWGVNWYACPNLLVRPEVRWDWADEAIYDDFSDTDQFLIAVDALVTF